MSQVSLSKGVSQPSEDDFDDVDDEDTKHSVSSATPDYLKLNEDQGVNGDKRAIKTAEQDLKEAGPHLCLVNYDADVFQILWLDTFGDAAEEPVEPGGLLNAS